MDNKDQNIVYTHEAMLPDILSPSQVSHYTGLCPSYVNSLMQGYEFGNQKGMPNFRVGKRRMVRKQELFKWLRNREQEMRWEKEKNRKYKKPS